MKTKNKVVASAALILGLVVGFSVPATAATTTGWVGACGGPTYPTVRYKINSYSEVFWRTAPNGAFLSNNQYDPNEPVYQTAKRQARSWNYVAYGNGTSFQYFDRACM